MRGSLALGPQGEKFRGDLVAAGPWADDTGALLVFDTERGKPTVYLTPDPYYRTPGVEVLGVREWAPVVAVNSVPA
ncbi:MAG TPA: hypothetical protein VHV74_01115 [Pseudonocardiaceae bacterium]|nr:hypothetical protein [Pseudonocardiaceae bacterium]